MLLALVQHLQTAVVTTVCTVNVVNAASLSASGIFSIDIHYRS